MGKLLRQQRRGKGSPAYKCPSHRYKAELSHRTYNDAEKYSAVRGEVMEFVDDPGRSAVLAFVRFEDGDKRHILAAEGMAVGDRIDSGAKAALGLGNVIPLSQIPDGAFIYNIELHPGDGGKLVRAPGAYATVVSREKDHVFVKLPSRKVVVLEAGCRAHLGIVCGGGRLELPLMKAGANFYKKHAQNRKWPVNRGVHMCAYSHPFGGKQHHKGRSSCTSRGAPPGRKVGNIAASSMGRRKARAEDQ